MQGQFKDLYIVTLTEYRYKRFKLLNIREKHFNLMYKFFIFASSSFNFDFDNIK